MWRSSSAGLPQTGPSAAVSSVSTIAAFRELVDEDPAPQTPAQCIDVLQRFLIGRLRNASVNSVVAKALHEIERNPTCPRVGDIAARCHVSPRHLNRLMRIWVGYGPKCLARVVRFQTTLEQIEAVARPVGRGAGIPRLGISIKPT